MNKSCNHLIKVLLNSPFIICIINPIVLYIYCWYYTIFLIYITQSLLLLKWDYKCLWYKVLCSVLFVNSSVFYISRLPSKYYICLCTVIVKFEFKLLKINFDINISINIMEKKLSISFLPSKYSNVSVVLTAICIQIIENKFWYYCIDVMVKIEYIFFQGLVYIIESKYWGIQL